MRNFGMPQARGLPQGAAPDGAGGAGSGGPILCFIDTPGAYPGVDAEERGQAEAIAKNLEVMSALPVPIVAAVIGEGGSGGALALGVADRILMLEYSVYSVISPGGLRVHPVARRRQEGRGGGGDEDDRQRPAPPGRRRRGGARGARRRSPRLRRHRQPGQALRRHLAELLRMPPEALRAERYQKFRPWARSSSRATNRREPGRRRAGAEALRVNARYVEELVIGWNLGPWAAKAWRDGAVARRVFLDAEPADGTVAAVVAFMTEADGNPGFEVGLAIFPRAAVALGAWEAFAERVRRAAGPFVVAAFHPDYRRDDEPADNAAQLVSALRRTPDPTLQFLRADRLAAVPADPRPASPAPTSRPWPAAAPPPSRRC